MATDKVHIMVEQIARLRVARVSDDSICNLFSLSRSGLSRLLATPEYKHAQEQALRGLIDNMDEALKLRSDIIRGQFAAVVPEAMKALVETVKQQKDLRARLLAAREILDRDPHRTLTKQEPGAPRTIDAEAIPDAVFKRITAESSNVLREP